MCSEFLGLALGFRAGIYMWEKGWRVFVQGICRESFGSKAGKGLGFTE